jgi:hypothetical protein
MDQESVTKMMPIDVSAVKDSGMQSLIILAHSLGWNVMQKHNTPVVITARDGVQKRLPTNTSIRMGVFQSALSTIMAHSIDKVPTIELVDAIITEVKPSVDHARRMRLAVGESPAEHRARVAAIEAESKGPREPEPLTQRIEIPAMEWAEPPNETPAENGAAPAAPDFTIPVDGEDHGKLISQKPYMAHHHATREGVVHTYQSDTSDERVWEDGFKDYVCQFCGAAFATPKGVGSHRQTHIKAGELPKDVPPAFARTDVRGVETGWKPTTQRSDKGVPRKKELAVPDVSEATTLDLIRQIVAAELIEELEHLRKQNVMLAQGIEELGAENAQLKKDWNALKELIGGG